MSNTLWIVHTGSGSNEDWEVEAVCSSEANALLVSGIFPDANKPYAIEVDEFLALATKHQGEKFYTGWVYRDTELDTLVTPSKPATPLDKDYAAPLPPKPGADAMTVAFWAKSDEDAIRLANRKRRAWLRKDAGQL